MSNDAAHRPKSTAEPDAHLHPAARSASGSVPHAHVAAGEGAAYEVRSSGVAGLGLFARRPIAAGERIIEYIGELIDNAEAERRYDDVRMDVHHTFLFALDDDRCIDGAVGGNEARYVNHSCAPNCEALDDGGRIFVEAMVDIDAGSELFYDYQYIVDERMTRAHVLLLYPCRCGAPTCRGSLAMLPPEVPAPAAAQSERPK